jgi:hypothetical protein
MVGNVEGRSSASKSFKLGLARSISLKGKLKSTFLLDIYRVALLRHCMLISIRVVPRENGWLGGLAGSVVDYVSIKREILTR